MLRALNLAEERYPLPDALDAVFRGYVAPVAVFALWSAPRARSTAFFPLWKVDSRGRYGKQLGREDATSRSRRLAIADDAKPRRRHPGQQIEPLRSAEPVPAADTERDGKLSETGAWIRDLAAQHHAFRQKLNERQHLMMPGDDMDWAALGGTLPTRRVPRRDAILQPAKPEITPSATILQHAAEHDIEPEAAG